MHALTGGVLQDLVQQVGQGPMGEGDDADLLPGGHQRQDHLRADVGLARSRRALHRQHRLVQATDDLAGGLLDGIGRRQDGRIGGLSGARMLTHQEVAGRPPRACSGDVVIGDPGTQCLERTALRVRVARALRDQGRRVRSLVLCFPAEVERAFQGIQPDDGARRAAGGRVDRRISLLQAIRLLRVEPISVHDRLPGAVDLEHPSDLADCLVVPGGELLVRAGAAVEEGPPVHLLLTAVPLEQVRQQPARLQRRVALPSLRIAGNALEQLSGKVGHALVTLARRPLLLFRRRAAVEIGHAELQRQRLALLLQPVSQLRVGTAVILVVEADLLQDAVIRRAGAHRADVALVGHDR